MILKFFNNKNEKIYKSSIFGSFSDRDAKSKFLYKFLFLKIMFKIADKDLNTFII